MLSINDFRGIHEDEACLLLGNGPSLDTIDLTRVVVPTIGMNRSWRKYNASYHCIFGRMPYLREIERGLHTPNVLFVASTGAEEVLRWMKIHIDMKNVAIINKASSPQVGWAEFPSKGWWPRLTGDFALRIAVYLGYNPIYLIGYDCGVDERHCNTRDANGPFADFRDAPQNRHNSVKRFHKLAEVLALVEPDLEIYNLSPTSAITCWPTADHSRVLS